MATLHGTVRNGWPPFGIWQLRHAQRHHDHLRARRLRQRALQRGQILAIMPSLEGFKSALRTVGDQLRLLDAACPRHRSQHDRGMAVDVGGDGSWIARARERGLPPLDVPEAGEHWHVEVRR